MAWSFFNEIGRKIIHLTILLVLIGYVVIENNYSKQIALLSLVALLMFFLLLEYFRLDLDWKIPFFSSFIRPKERERMYGVIYFLSGTIICLAVFDFKIALAALLMTTFGDMAAALIGRRYGVTILFKSKTVKGAAAELIVNLLVGFVVLIGHTTIYIPIAMAVMATFVETFVDELDDNLLVPLFSGFVGQILLYVF